MIKPTRFRATAEIAINDNLVLISGDGSVDNDAGIIVGKYEIKDLPSDIDPKIFKTVLVTGYPSVCADNGKREASPFKAGDYSYSRLVDFDQHGSISYSAQCKLIYDDVEREVVLDSYFRGIGTLSMPSLGEGFSISEMWAPKNGGIDGYFDIIFDTPKSNNKILGRATTEYIFDNNSKNLSSVEHRYISFPNLSSTRSSLSLEQHSFRI